MFAVIYRSYIRPECEIEYQALWNQLASYFIQHRGAIGSCLHKTEDGIWLAYSRWPDKATRDASWSSGHELAFDLPEEVKKLIANIKNCADPDRQLPEICMEVVDDLLFK